MSLEKLKLDNGLTIYNDHITGARTNDVRMFVPYGSVDEQLGHEGVAHVFEHCVHLKTDRFGDRVDLQQFADTNGMYTNASTNFSRTDYYANGLELEPSLIHLSEILQHTHFPEEEVAHELKAVRREMKTRLDSHGEAHFLGAMNAIFGLPYGRSIGGYHDKLDFDVETLRALHAQYYKLGRMSLLVTGKARTDEVAELASRYFAADSDPTFTDHPALPRTLGDHHRTGLVREDSSNALVSVSYPVDNEFNKRITNNPLAYGMAQRAMSQAAFQTLRYDRGLSYNGSIGIEHVHPNAVLLSSDVTTDPENVTAAIGALGEIFSKDSASYSDEVLMGTMRAYQYSFNAQYNSNAARMGRIEAALEEDREPTDMSRVMRRIGKVGIADIRSAIDDCVEYAATNPAYVHVTGKRDAIGDVDRLIEQAELA